MSKNQKSDRLTRRGFLVAAPVAGLAAGVADAAPLPDAAPAKPDHRTVTLADTPHIRKFYELARG